jgi:transcriptional regulator with XRE-family HTH domain
VQKDPHSPSRRRLRELLVAVREEAGMNQGDLARALDVPQSLVSRFETGDRRIDLIELEEVCAAVGISLQELVRRFVEGGKPSSQ